MLKYPYPWGKQRGGGAPKISNSGTMNNCFGKLEFKSNGSSTNKDGYNPFGRPGGGAPIKSDSGTFVTALVGDPNIRFQKQLKKEINQTLVNCTIIIIVLIYNYYYCYCYCYYDICWYLLLFLLL